MVGQRLGHYLVIARIGGGGMGVVYRARDERLHRDVALKVLSAPAGQTDSAARLLREARAAAALRHPAICTVYEIGDQDGVPYLVMELLEGRTLAETIAERPFTPLETARIGGGIAEALAYAHGQRVLHRDLKPSNIVLTPGLRPHLLDFGLARRPAADDTGTLPRLTETDAISGTMSYMAPEVLRGAEPDVRGDVWALGVVLHEMLSGVPPFAGRTAPEVMGAILHQPPQPLPPGTPPALAAVITRALDKDPARRFAGAAELGAALEACVTALTPGVERARTEVIRPARRSRPRVIGAAAGLAVAIVIVTLVLWPRPRPVDALAVLPLTNYSHDPDQAFFADGMTDELTTTLGQIGALKVIAHTSVADYDPHRTPLRQLGRDLGVGAVVTGSVYRSGDHVRIVAQLVDVQTGQVRWSQSYDRPLRDVLALQNEVSRAIAEQVRAELSPGDQARLAHAPSVNPEAYQAYLRGRAAWDAADSAGFVQSVKWFQRAIELDPGYAPAYAGLSDAYWGLAGWVLDPNSVMPAGIVAARQAIALDDRLPEGHVALATAMMDYALDWPAAEREFHRALELNPNHAAAHRQYGWLLRYQGRAAEDSSEVAKSIALDPLSVFSQCQAGWPQYFARRYRESAEIFQRTIQLHPDQFVVYQGLGLALEQLGDHEGSIRALRRCVELLGGSENRAFLAHALATGGHPAEAKAIVANLERASGYVSPADLSLPYLALGDRGRALTLIERGFRERAGWTQFLNVDPRFDALRDEPRFKAVAGRLGHGQQAPVTEGKSS